MALVVIWSVSMPVTAVVMPTMIVMVEMRRVIFVIFVIVVGLASLPFFTHVAIQLWIRFFGFLIGSRGSGSTVSSMIWTYL